MRRVQDGVFFFLLPKDGNKRQKIEQKIKKTQRGKDEAGEER